MIQINLNEQERRILINLLDDCIADLRMEIAATDNHDYKQMLKNRKQVLVKLSEALAVVDQAEFNKV